jgi:hypothetical protein
MDRRGRKKVHSKVQLERLIVDVVHTLRDAHMQDALRAFNERVLSLEPEYLFDAPEGAEPKFKPMFELLLRELAALATDTSLPLHDREIRATEAMHLAGF